MAGSGKRNGKFLAIAAFDLIVLAAMLIYSASRP